MQTSRRPVRWLHKHSNLLSVACSAVSLLLGVFLFREAYYALCMLLLLSAMIPFFAAFEKKKPKAGELAVMAVLTALAIAGRAAFFMLPQVKPMAAIVIITGIALGKRDGFMVGAIAAFVSNFLFGQGIWTPFQMFALGLTGFLAGYVFEKDNGKPNRWLLAIFGLIAVFFVYGVIADLSSVLFLTGGSTLTGIVAVYMAGIPFNLIHAAVTAAFLLLFGQPLLDALERLQIKYNFLENGGIQR